MNKQTVYTNGLFFNKPHEKAPEYVIGGLAVHVERFQQWLSEQEVDEKGYVKIDIMEGREKPYCKLNTWKKSEKTEQNGEPNGAVKDVSFEETPVVQPVSSVKFGEEELDINDVPF